MNFVCRNLSRVKFSLGALFPLQILCLGFDPASFLPLLPAVAVTAAAVEAAGMAVEYMQTAMETAVAAAPGLVKN